jgi:hypothetical protein
VSVRGCQWRAQEFCSGGEVQQIQLRTEGRENGDLGPVALYSGVLLNLQSGSTLSNFRDVEGCYGCIFHGTGNSAQLCQNFGISGGRLNPQNPPRYATAQTRGVWWIKGPYNAPMPGLKSSTHLGRRIKECWIVLFSWHTGGERGWCRKVWGENPPLGRCKCRRQDNIKMYLQYEVPAVCYSEIGKGKAIPLQAWTGP